MFRLLGGPIADTVDWKSPDISKHLSELYDYVHDLMKGTVEERFDKWYQDFSCSFNTTSKWTLMVPPRGKNCDKAVLQ